MNENNGDQKKRPQGFKPGQSGNPAGRPRRFAVLQDFLDVKVKVTQNSAGKPIEPYEISRIEALVASVYGMATDVKGKVPERLKAAELMLAYKFGKPTESVELSGYDGGPIEHEHTDVTSRTSGEMRKRIAELEATAAAREATGGSNGANGQH